MTLRVDVVANRRSHSWSLPEKLGRVAWRFCHPLFRFSPRIFWGWRVWLLRCFGARIGRGVHIYPSVRITIPWHLSIGDQVAIGDHAILYALGRITIAERATISQYAHLCAGSHDWRDPARPLQRLPIHVGADAWICADSFVGPGVRIGEGAVVGARAVAMRDVPDRHIAVGNPAKMRVQT